MKIADLVWRSGMTRAQLARSVGLTVSTLDRYCREDRAPASVRQLLEVYAGRLPWPGCERLNYIRGAIYHGDNPDGLPVGEIPAYTFRLKQLDALERELTRYRRAPAQYLLDLPTP